MADAGLKKYLTPTAVIDSDHPAVIAYAADIVKDVHDAPVAKAVKLYYGVRDGIWYDPYLPFYRPEHYQASQVLTLGRAFCIGKAALLCALGRACGIPSRIGFADVRNHLATRQLIDYLGSDIFVFHGYTEFFLNGSWIKATPAFNRELCRKHHVVPLEFDGREDSVFHPYNADKKLFMEYLCDHGSFVDVPVDRIVAAMQQEYGRERVGSWMETFAHSGNIFARDFTREDVV